MALLNATKQWQMTGLDETGEKVLPSVFIWMYNKKLNQANFGDHLFQGETKSFARISLRPIEAQQ